ncbi:PAS domain S-box protein [Aerosakkonema funiforme]|uniref:PAS domain S-box protein n=1 Tax=Aerosakkonema funiforme TaxID=1246630 RepID=UPI0035BB237E
MSENVLPLYSPDLNQVLDRSPLIVSPNALLLDVLVQMSQVRGSLCMLAKSEATTGLNSNGTSCVLVIEESRLVGVFTERDLVKLTVSRRSFKGVTIAQVMTHPVITLIQDRKSFDVFTAIAMMRQHRIRHLPILDTDGKLLGVVTSESLRQALQPSNLFRIRQVAEVMTRPVIAAPTTASVLELAELMGAHRVSCVVIYHPTKEKQLKPVGIVTERDILQFQVLDLDLAKIQAQTVMSAPLFCLSPQDLLWTAHQEMLSRRVQRLIVVGEVGELVGIVTQTTLLRSLDPLEMYGVVQTLHQSVSKLEAEKIELLKNRNIELENQVQERTAQVRQQAEGERLLRSIASRIRQSLKLEDILNSTVTEVRQILKCDRVMIYHFLPNMDGRVVAESVDFGWTAAIESQIEDTCFIDGGVTKYIQGKQWACHNIYTANLTPCHLELLENLQVKSNLVVPILIADNLWGLLIAHQCSHPREWQTFELELLDQLSVQIAISIQQSKALEKAETELAERIRTEEALRQSEQRYATLTKAAPVGIFCTDMQGNCTYVNERCCEIMGVTADELLTKGWANRLHPEDCDRVLTEWDYAIKKKKPFRSEYRFICPDGTITWVLGQAIAEKQNNQQDILYVGTITDISDRKHVESALQTLNEELESKVQERTKELAFQKFALDQAAIVSITEEKGIITYVNDKFCEIYQYSQVELIANTHNLINSGYHSKSFFKQMWQTIASGQVWRGEIKNQDKNGNYHWVDTTIVPSKNALGKPYQYLSIGFDITQRKQAEEALSLSEVRFRSLFEAAADFIHVVDLDGLIWQTNPASIQQSGYTEIELIGHRIDRFFTACSQKIFAEMFPNLLQTGTQRLEVEFICKDGTITMMDLSSSVARDENGQFAYIVIIQRDISDRKQTEQSLKRQLAAIEAAMDGIAILDENSQYSYLNQAHAEMFGYRNAIELLGKNWQELYYPREIANFQKEVFPALGNTGKFQGETTAKRKDGSTFDEEVSLTLIEGVGLICVCRDITQRKQAEALLAKRDRYLTALVEVQRQLLASPVDNETYNLILSNLGQVCDVSRIYIFENHQDSTGRLLTSQRAEWCAEKIEPQIENQGLQNFPLDKLSPNWLGALSKGDIIEGTVTEFPEPERQILADQGILSILILPLIVNGEFFGFIGFDNCIQARVWEPLEISILSSAATAISIAKESQMAEEALQQAKGKLQAVLDTVPGFVSWISSDLKYLGVNRHLSDTFKLPVESFIGQPIGFLENSREFVQFISQFFAISNQTDSQTISIETNGQERSYLVVAQKYNSDRACVSVGLDITERENAEEQIKASLKEKEVLLKEIHHRVKNNLQIISSMIDLQSQFIDSPEMMNIFLDSQSRIQSMALIHEQLYQSKDLAKIDFSDYVANLVDNLFSSYGVDQELIKYIIDIDNVCLNLDTSIPCGLIINELVSNALKHAFPYGREGEIWVQLYLDEQNHIILSVSDNGIGFPENLNFQKIETSLGLQLVCTLTKQLKGNIELDRNNGTRFKLTLSELKYRRKN